MRLILGTSTSSSSSMVKLPLHQAHHGRRTGSKAKPKPNSKSKLSPDSKHSIAEFSPSTTSPPPPTVPSSHARLLSSVRWDFTSQHKYHADLASKLAEDGRLEEFVMIVESVVVSGGSGSNFVSLLRFELVSRGIVGSLLEGRFHCVAGVLKKVEKLGVPPLELFDGNSFQILKKECEKMVDCGEMEKFVDLIDTLAGFRFPIKELGDSSRVVKYCVDKRDTNLAIRYGSIFPHAHILFCTIIREFGKKKDLVSALTVYEASKKNLIGPNMYIYRTIIDVCGLCGDYMQSRSIYEDLLRQKIALNIYVFNSVMNVNAHDLDFSLQVYKNIKELGIVADMTSYNILLKACCLAGRVDLAQKIYREVKRLESKGVLKLDVFTYSTIVKVFADAKLWQMALEIKEDMLSAGVTPNTVTWSSLINACANAGLVEQALHLFDDMLLAGCEPNSQCCNILLQACVEACQYDRAFRLFYSWKQRSSHEAFCEDCDGNHGSILSTEPKQNHSVSDNGTQSFVSNPRHLSFVKSFLFKPTTTTYNILMKACGTDYYRAKALMDEMRTADLSPNHISWSILIDTCGGLGNVEGAVQILNSMREAGINPDVVAYTAAIKVCVKNKSLKLAFSLFGEMKQYQIKPNLVTYNTLLRARSRYGSLHEVQQCLAVYQDMRKAGFKSVDHYLKELIEEWCEGVIQHNNQNQKELTSSKGTNLRPQSLLLEKVAEHLQKSTTDSLAVDLRGLTKVEARIVILAVLRMIKENHSLGIPVKDDMLIILGPNKVGVNPAKYEDLEVKDAITKLLHNDLGINVSLVRPTTALDKNVDLDKPLDSDPNSEEILGRLQMKFKSSTRRPAILQRLKVTKKSLHCWLQRRTGASTR